MIRPRRSVLFVPGSNSRALEKARSLPVDGVILDLEDSVAPEVKDLARDQVSAALQAGGFGERELFIRINSSGTPWHRSDLAAAVQASPDGIILPKVGAPSDILSLDGRIREVRGGEGIAIWAMMETPAGILNAASIAAAAAEVERFRGLVMGTNDLARETLTRIVPGRTPMLPWLMTCLVAARANGLAILDGVFNDIADEEGFSLECRESRDMGFDGKTLIHPRQIAPANLAFSPSPEEVAQARQVIEAFDRPENRERGAIELDGRMVERLHAEMARRVVEIHEEISGRD